MQATSLCNDPLYVLAAQLFRLLVEHPKDALSLQWSELLEEFVILPDRCVSQAWVYWADGDEGALLTLALIHAATVGTSSAFVQET